jgi:hypothetical protein
MFTVQTLWDMAGEALEHAKMHRELAAGDVVRSPRLAGTVKFRIPYVVPRADGECF